MTMKRSGFTRATSVLASRLSILIAGTALAAMPAAAEVKTISGSSNGLSWSAKQQIVGVLSTGTVVSGGSPTYLPNAAHRGVVGLVMEYSDGSAFVCSGSLMNDRQSVLTAGHCVSDGAGTPGPAKVTAFFYDGDPADPQFYQDYLFGIPAPGVTQVDVSKVFVNPLYTGEVIDQNDIAVVRLADLAPAFANDYDLYDGDLHGAQYNIAGYGGRSSVGGAVGSDLGTGRLRQGDNRFDFALGDSEFGGFFTSSDPACGGGSNWFCGDAAIDYSFLADFDNGLPGNDSSCILAQALGVAPSSKFCDLGLGFDEVTSAGGDSGGPEFINGQVAAVTSYGLSFGSGIGDIDDDLNDTFGEFGGYVPVSLHRNFIWTAMFAVPEPATWLQMIGGFALLGGALRRRSHKVAFAV